MSAREEREDRRQQDDQAKAAKHQPETNKKERTGGSSMHAQRILYWDSRKVEKIMCNFHMSLQAIVS